MSDDQDKPEESGAVDQGETTQPAEKKRKLNYIPFPKGNKLASKAVRNKNPISTISRQIERTIRGLLKETMDPPRAQALVSCWRTQLECIDRGAVGEKIAEYEREIARLNQRVREAIQRTVPQG